MAKFRTKARAVELLGKGQIADLPTAISELWKNGYDAYADKVELAIYKPGYEDIIEPLLIISDDGKGMSRKDIFEKCAKNTYTFVASIRIAQKIV